MSNNNKPLKITTIVGARPQFIKAASISRAITDHNNHADTIKIEEQILHTGQHYDHNMSQIFFDELEIPAPHINLEVSSGSHGTQTGRMLEKIEFEFLKNQPDIVLVYGDTNSTLAGALAATKLHIPIAHVEAGLRSYNKEMPEEINRILTDNISNILFCPTDTAVKNLSKENITKGVYQIGDVMYDCCMFYKEKSKLIEFNFLKTLSVTKKNFQLATIHRAENTDDPEKLTNIFKALVKISSPEYPTILPLHPRTRKLLQLANIIVSDAIHLVDPVSYLQMVALEVNARLILTDSGGVQKEAFIHKVPCITLRNETEWVETVDSGWNRLVGSDTKMILNGAKSALSALPKSWPSFYGDGNAAIIICDLLSKYPLTIDK